VAIFSFGLLALIVGGALFAYALSDRWEHAREPKATAGAVAAGIALPLLVVFAIQGPLVSCDENGAQAGENLFLGLGSSSGSSESLVPLSGDATGREEGESYVYMYRRRDGELARFDLTWR